MYHFRIGLKTRVQTKMVKDSTTPLCLSSSFKWSNKMSVSLSLFYRNFIFCVSVKSGVIQSQIWIFFKVTRNYFAHFKLATFAVSVFPRSFLAAETACITEAWTFLVWVYNAVSKCGIVFSILIYTLNIFIMYNSWMFLLVLYITYNINKAVRWQYIFYLQLLPVIDVRCE